MSHLRMVGQSMRALCGAQPDQLHTCEPGLSAHPGPLLGRRFASRLRAAGGEPPQPAPWRQHGHRLILHLAEPLIAEMGCLQGRLQAASYDTQLDDSPGDGRLVVWRCAPEPVLGQLYVLKLDEPLVLATRNVLSR
ncbi:unnamed protein product [Effrenium voratum]|nr:unnamed protein product [Effrenium voratum]